MTRVSACAFSTCTAYSAPKGKTYLTFILVCSQGIGIGAKAKKNCEHKCGWQGHSSRALSSLEIVGAVLSTLRKMWGSSSKKGAELGLSVCH